MADAGGLAWPDRTSTRRVLRLAWPLVLSNSLWTAQIVYDRVLLARSGSALVGAGMSAALLFWTGLMLFQYTANYATTFVAQYTGAGLPHRVGAVVWQALWFALASGVAFVALWPLAGPLVALAGHSPELQHLEITYFRCLCLSALPALLAAAASSFFAGRGDSRTVFFINGTGLVVHALCAYAWVFGHWGFAARGIAGAGWATVAGTSTSALLALALMLRRAHRRRYGTASGWRPDGPLFVRLMRFGVPNGIGAALDVLGFTLFITLVGRLGEPELAATSVAFTLNLFAFLPMMGVGQAVEILVGQHLGEDRPEEAERATWAGLVVVLTFTLVVGLLYALAPGILAELFRPEGEDIRWGEVRAHVPRLLCFVAVYCLFDGVNLTFSYALRGAGDTRFVTAGAALLLSWPVMVLPAWLAWRRGWGLYWAWGFASLYIILLAFTFLLRFLGGRWRSMRVIERAGEVPALEGPRPAPGREPAPAGAGCNE